LLVSIASEMTGLLAEHAFVEILEGGGAVEVVGDDPGPVVVTVVAGGSLGDPFEFASGVASVVPAVATAAFPLVLEGALERVDKCAQTLSGLDVELVLPPADLGVHLGELFGELVDRVSAVP
jgi:hypothetical protein